MTADWPNPDPRAITCSPRPDRLRAPFQDMRSGGRVVEGARLESEYTSKAYRGFESLPLRQLPPVNRCKHYDLTGEANLLPQVFPH